jgi:hypothetical protein
MNTTSPSLLEKLRQPGDRAAWERFMDLYTTLLHHWAKRLGRQASDADALAFFGAYHQPGESADVNFTLSNTRLVGLGVDTLVGVNGAMLTGGAGNNLFDVSGWTLPAVIDGGAGSDMVLSTNNANFVLSDRLLTRTGRAPVTLAGIENARLTGGVGNNVINAAAFTGLAQLSGGAGVADALLDRGAGDVVN